MLLVYAPVIRAQQQDSLAVKNLIFEGAGIRGIAYCGAITALALSLGYTHEEIAALISATDFKKFNDGRYMFAGGINHMQKYFGWYRGHEEIFKSLANS